MKTLGNVSARFGQAQRTQQTSSCDSLLQSLKFRALQNGEEFRLPAQNDLQQLFMIGIGITEQANFFQQLDGHEMGFVDQENGGATLLLGLKQHLMQRGQAARLAGRSAVDFVLIEDGFEQLRRSERRIH